MHMKFLDNRQSKSNLRSTKLVKPVSYIVVAAILAILPLFITSTYTLHILIICFIYVIVTVSFRSIMISGQFSLAHAAYMGVGAYLSSMASLWLGWSPWVTIFLAALVTAGLGMLIGLPFARLRALYYALGTLFFGIGIIYIIYAGGKVTGGYSGLAGIPSLFPSATSKVPYYFFVLILTILCLAALYRFEFCRIGVNLKAIDQSHLVASSIGIDEAWYRILAVGVGNFFVGLAGATYAHYNMVIAPGSFNFAATLWIVMYVFIGGTGNFAGPIIGTFLLYPITQYSRFLQIYSPFVSAALLGIVAYFLPKGLTGIPESIIKLHKNRKNGQDKVKRHIDVA